MNIIRHRLIALLIRWAIGAVFIYMGASKAFDPVAFLKLVHQYNLTENYWLLNAIAAMLPWFEIFCGILLALGVAVRGTALVMILMLVPFTWVVFQHALEIQSASHIAFCAVKFDCGCGNGEVFICRKLAENFVLVILLAWLMFKGKRTPN